MEKCSYHASYFDVKLGKSEIYYCTEETIPESSYCIFHNKEYWKDHKHQVKERFLNKLEESLKTNNLKAIGYELPFIDYHGKFPSELYLSETTFHEGADFSHAEFQNGSIANFDSATFFEVADFSSSTFNGESSFISAVFYKPNFDHVQFNSNVNFNAASFRSPATFRKAKFYMKAWFVGTFFLCTADFSRAEFSDEALFLNTFFLSSYDKNEDADIKQGIQEHHFNVDSELSPIGPLFVLAQFCRPLKVVFDRVDLSRASFLDSYNADKIRFYNIAWQKKGRRKILFEEEVFEKAKKNEYQQLCGNNVDLSHITMDDVLSVYRNLKDAYEREAKYDEAGEFFVSEMEFKRNYSPNGKKSFPLRVISLHSLYNLLSRYGESYNQTIFWMVVAILVFTAIRFIPQSGSPSLSELDGYIWESINAFFQNPIGSHTYTNLAERVVSLALMGVLFISLKREFERKVRK